MASSAIASTPPETPTSPSVSFYDMSDDEEGEYNTIMHSRSGRGVKLLFSKSKVYEQDYSTSEPADPSIRSMYIPLHHRKTIFQASWP